MDASSFCVAVMVTLPVPTPVTTPFASTVATDGLPDVQMTSSGSAPVSTSILLSPTIRFFVWLIDIVSNADTFAGNTLTIREITIKRTKIL